MADEEVSPEEESREELIQEPISLDASAPELVQSDIGNNTVGNITETEFIEANEDYEEEITEPLPVDESIPVSESIPKTESLPKTEQISAKSDGTVDVEAEKSVSAGVQPVERTKVSQKSRLSAKFHKKEQPRQTERQFLEMIGKHEVRNEELGRKEGALRHRLDVLECSMPAVMVWNIWRMAQGAPVTGLRRIVERQFRHVTEGPVCPRTPSRHYDCRVREIEAERKLAQKRVEEARSLCAEKSVNLEEKQKKLDEAKRTQEERKRRLEELTKELKNLKDNLMDASSGDCIAGECGDIQCCERWMKKVTSNTSIKSIDIDYLERIQELAEAELCMKKQIADLEYREDTYMRTLQEADDCWAKLDSDSSQSDLDRKQDICRQLAERVCELEDQLERMRSKFAKCIGELEKYLSIEKIETLIGGDDDMASTYDKATCIKAKLSGKIIGRDADFAGTADVGSLAYILQSDRSIGRQADLIGISDREIGVKPGDLDYEAAKQAELNKYFSMLGSLDELDQDDDFVCEPDFICNDVVTSPTGMDAVELARMEKELDIKSSMKMIEGGKAASGKDLHLEFVDFKDEEYDEEYVCDADFICNDVVTSPTGMDDDELKKYESGAIVEKVEIGVQEELEEITKYESVIGAEKESGEGIFVLEEESEIKAEEELAAGMEEEVVSEMERAVTSFEEEEISAAISDKGVGPESEGAELLEEVSGMVAEELEEMTAEEIASALEAEESARELEAEESEIAEQLESGIELAEAIAEEEELPEAITEELAVAEEEVSEEVAAEAPEGAEVGIPGVEGVFVPQKQLVSWLNTLQPIQETIEKCDTCVVKADSARDLATSIASYAGVELELAAPPEEEIEKVAEEEAVAEVEAEKPAEVEEVAAEPEEAVEIEEAKEEVEIEVPEEAVEIEEAKEEVEIEKAEEEGEEAIEAAPEVAEEPVEGLEVIEEEVAEKELLPEEEEEGVVLEVEEGVEKSISEMVEAEEELVAEIEEGEVEAVAEIEEGEVEAVAEIEEEVEALPEIEEGEIPVEVEAEEELEAELEEGEIPVEIEEELGEEEKEEITVDLITEEMEEGEEVPLELIEEEVEPTEEEALEEEILEEELPAIEEEEITEEDLLPEVPLPEAEEEEEEILAEEIPAEELEEIIEEEEEVEGIEIEEEEELEEEEEEVEEVKEIEVEGEFPVEIVEEEEEEEAIIEKPEIEILDIEPIEEKVKPYEPIKKVVKPSMLIDPQKVSKPYLSVAEIEQRDKESVKPMIQKYLQFVNRLCAMQPSVSDEIKIIKSEITKTETVQTELLQSQVCQKLTQTLIATDSQAYASITIPTSKVQQDTTMSKLYEKSRGTCLTSPKKTQCQFLKWAAAEQTEQVETTADKSSQTDRSMSRDRSSKDARHSVSIDEGTKLGKYSKAEMEQELRSINYKKSDEPQGECVCCACGKPNQGQKRLVAPLPPLIHPIPMQPMKKPAVPFLKDGEPCKLCPDCKRRKQKLSEEPKSCKKPKSPALCDSSACVCASSISKTKILSILLKNYDKPGRKDQGCMAKIPKVKYCSQDSRKQSPEKKQSDHKGCCCAGRKKDGGKSKDQ